MANPLSVITKPLSAITNLGDWKSPNGAKALQGIVKRDWVPTGRIDFATKIDRDDDPTQPGEFKLLVEERRIIESVAGNEHLEIQWRLATLTEAKAVVTQYHKYLAENSLIKSVSDPDVLPPAPKDNGAPSGSNGGIGPSGSRIRFGELRFIALAHRKVGSRGD